MLKTFVLCGLVGLFAASAVADVPVVQNSCAATLCITGTTCREVYYPSEGVIRGVCFVPRPTGNENRCSDGQPLYVNSSRRGIVEANCGESLEAIGCPSGYVCNSDPADAYAVCCPDYSPSTSTPGPRPEKPGECPAPGSLNCLRVQNCAGDRSCSGSQKCCKNRCGGYICVAPVTPATSCQNTKCPRNQRCVMDVVICKTNPCPPRPRCVPLGVSVEKPGQCPAAAPGDVGICAFTCSSDGDCTGDRKCCSTPCGGSACQSPVVVEPRLSCNTVKCQAGQVCVMKEVRCIRAPCFPVPECVPAVSVEKPGQCPAAAPGDVGICAFTCSNDGDCTGDRKCCRTPCGGTACQSPVVQQRPSCNTVKCSAGFTCVMELPANCIFRKPCFEEPKCVPIEREGVCPRLSARNATLGRPRVCPRECVNDAECPQFQKCCTGPNGCGTVCQDPEPTNTCANVKCRAGQVCVMREVQCVRAPCFPIPECVPAEPERTCPIFPAFVDPNCKRSNDCSLDGTKRCPSGLLCCSHPCGLSCFRPV